MTKQQPRLEALLKVMSRSRKHRQSPGSIYVHSVIVVVLSQVSWRNIYELTQVITCLCCPFLSAITLTSLCNVYLYSHIFHCSRSEDHIFFLFLHVMRTPIYRCWSKILCGTIHTPAYDLEVKVTDLEIYIKVLLQSF